MQVHGDNAVEDALGVHGYGTEDYAVMADNPYKGQLGGQWTELEAVDTGLSAVTHTAFDPFEELLWTANDVGKLTSYYPSFQEEMDAGPIWCKYSSFQGHVEAVTQMIVEQWGVLSLSQNCVRVHTKGGLPTQNFSHEGMHNLLSFAYTDARKSTLCLGGNLNKIFNYDVQQNLILTTADTTQGTAVVKYNGRLVCCGGTAGDISLRDSYTLQQQMVIPRAHATISDFDVKGVLLVSCGFQESIYDDGQWDPDPLIKVFDLRMPVRELAALQPMLMPYLLKFHPLFPSSLTVVGQTGALQFLDVNTSQMEGGLYQVFNDHQAATSHITAFDLSSSSEALAFGDNTGLVHTWGRKEAPIVNNFSDPTDQPINNMPNMAAPPLAADGSPLIMMEDSPFSLAPLPDSDGPLLSSWPPPHYMVLLGSRPRRVKPAILKALQYRDVVGHAANPGLPNVWAAYESESEDDYPDPWPRNETFGHDPADVKEVLGRPLRQLLRLAAKAAIESPVAPSVSRLMKPATPQKPSPLHTARLSMATKYRMVEVQENRLSWDDFEFGRYNGTPFRGLENTLPHSYTNALLQALFFMMPARFPLRALFLSHMCKERFCLSCEMGFLFHMMSQPHGGSGTPAQPSNFVRVLRCVKEADGRGLFEIDDGATSGAGTRLMQRIQEFVRFLLPHSAAEFEATQAQKPGGEAAKRRVGPERLLGIGVATVNTCGCGASSVEQDAASQLYLDVCFMAGDRRRTSQDAGLDLDPNTPQQSPSRNLPDTPARRSLLFGGSPAANGGYTPVKALPPSAFEAELEECLNNRPTMTAAFPTTTRGWCPRCARPQPMRTTKTVTSLPMNICMNVNIPLSVGGEKGEDPLWWRPANGDGLSGPFQQSPFSHMSNSSDLPDIKKFTPPAKLFVYQVYLTEEARAMGLCQWYVRSSPDPKLLPPLGLVHEYHLTSVISHIKEPLQTSRKEGHLVAHVLVSDTQLDSWYLFNDFCVSASSLSEAMCQLLPGDEASKHGAATIDWQTPVVTFYSRMPRKGDSEMADLPRPQLQCMANPAVDQLLLHDDGCMTRDRRRNTSFVPLSAAELPKKRDIVSLDAEFVLFGWDSKTSKPSQVVPVLGLARVSVCRVSGEAFLDDYIATDERVEDYLTRWSGIVPGDLDPSISFHHVTTLKNAYLKLRALVDRGVIFVGHGLKKDFRIINIHVPKNQIIDTVDLFHQPRQRKISLKFLAFHLLGKRIQQETHNSIEDAMIAMRLYKKYLQLKESNEFQAKLQELYDIGNRDNWVLQGESGPPVRGAGAGGSGNMSAHEKRRLHYQQLLKDRHEQQRKEAEGNDAAAEPRDATATTGKPNTRLNTNAKPFVPPAPSGGPAPPSTLNTNAKPFVPPAPPSRPPTSPFEVPPPPPPPPPPLAPFFVPPTTEAFSWGLEPPVPTIGRPTTVQQLFQEHQHMQRQQLQKAYQGLAAPAQFVDATAAYFMPPLAPPFAPAFYPEGPYPGPNQFPMLDGYGNYP